MPPEDIFAEKIQEIEGGWAKDGEEILQEIAEATKLQWQEKEIVCYIIAGSVNFSDPVTLTLKSDIDTLTHELIHRIFTENWGQIKEGWMKFMARYRGEPQMTKAHIPVYAVQVAVLEKLFDKERLEKVRKRVRDPHYIRAWEILDRDGHTETLKNLTENF